MRELIAATLSPTDVFLAVFGAGVLLVGAFVLVGTALLYAYHWIKGDKDW